MILCINDVSCNLICTITLLSESCKIKILFNAWRDSPTVCSLTYKEKMTSQVPTASLFFFCKNTNNLVVSVQ